MEKKCHFIGIGGIGMSGLAKILLSRNKEVTGSDLASNYVTEELVKSGAKVYIGHSAHHIPDTRTVVYSSDIKEDNPEYQQAVQLNCSLKHRSELLRDLMHGYKPLAVTGTHGKTTTSSLLTSVLMEAALDPTFVVGGIISQFKSNAQHGRGEYFVVEADESDGTFLNYHPFGAIITNIDFDHMNHFKTEEFLLQSFSKFAGQVISQEHLFWCRDDERLAHLGLPGIPYGFTNGNALRARNFKQNGWKIVFDIEFKGRLYSQVEASVIGRYNALNVLAVFGLAISLGIPEEKIRSALLNFRGVGRRCEKKGELHGVLFLDDYAHHPTEIEVTLKGIRESIGDRRLVAIFQPHRYSRVKDCLGTYGKIFEEVDHLFITDIYGSGEHPIPGLTYELILEEIQQKSSTSCEYVSRHQLGEHLSQYLRPHDVLVTLGAGDVTKVSHEIMHHYGKKTANKLKIGLIFGGSSPGYDASIACAEHSCDALNSELYDVSYFGITKQGKWICGPRTLDRLHLKSQLPATKGSGELVPMNVLKELLECDLLFPTCYGAFGEDGSMQGLLEMIQKPYVGCNYRATVLCLNRKLSKQIAQANEIAVAPFVSFTDYTWKTEREQLLKQLQRYPLSIKSVHLSAAAETFKVEEDSQLEPAIKKIFQSDREILIENWMEGSELQFAVIGNDQIYAYPCANTELSPQLVESGQLLAERAYRAMGCTGMAVASLFLDSKDKWWFSEMNPLGLTNELSNQALMDQLVVLALQHLRAQRHPLL